MDKDSFHLTSDFVVRTVPGEPKLRILEIESELAEMKRRYLVDGIEGDRRKRATQEAELAALSIQRFKNRAEAEANKMAAKEAKTKTFLALLCQKVEDAGFAHLIHEAQAESLQYIKSIGMYEAYSSKESA